MTTQRILVPTDFSASADAALKYAAALARSLDASLVTIHVKVEPALSGPCDDEFDAQEPQLHRRLEDFRPSDSAIECEHHFLRAHGNPGNEIVKFAKEEQVIAILMGAHGVTGDTSRVMGAVAEAVARKAPCPVLTFVAPQTEAAASEIAKESVN